MSQTKATSAIGCQDFFVLGARIQTRRRRLAKLSGGGNFAWNIWLGRKRLRGY